MSIPLRLCNSLCCRATCPTKLLIPTACHVCFNSGSSNDLCTPERVVDCANLVVFNSCQLLGSLQVISQIVGEAPLPWEDPAKAPAIHKRFGLFKDVILELLERDPDLRPSMSSFTRSCRQVLALTTSQR